MSSYKKYGFSFTAGSLMWQELVVYATCLVENGFKIELLDAAELNKEKAKTNKREFAEVKLRLTKLHQEEIEMLHSSDVGTQKLLAYVAFCRSYDFFKDFVLETLLHKVQVFDYQLTDRDYNAFINRKEVDHDELFQLSDLTKSKIKQVTFKVLEQAGIIDNIKTKLIQPPSVSFKLENWFQKHHPESLVYLFKTKYS